MPADRVAEQELRKAYALVVPADQKELYEQTELPDMDFRFFSGASEGLVLPFLSGDEDVRLFHLDAEGELVFQLPGERPCIGLDIGSGVLEPQVVLHTVMFRMEDRQVDLLWRAAKLRDNVVGVDIHAVAPIPGIPVHPYFGPIYPWRSLWRTYSSTTCRPVLWGRWATSPTFHRGSPCHLHQRTAPIRRDT